MYQLPYICQGSINNKPHTYTILQYLSPTSIGTDIGIRLLAWVYEYWLWSMLFSAFQSVYVGTIHVSEGIKWNMNTSFCLQCLVLFPCFFYDPIFNSKNFSFTCNIICHMKSCLFSTCLLLAIKTLGMKLHVQVKSTLCFWPVQLL